jgi:hypothetical protein
MSYPSEVVIMTRDYNAYYVDPGYRREAESYRPRVDYDSYRADRVYRGAEVALGYDGNYARDYVRLRAAQEKPKSLSKAAGR